MHRPRLLLFLALAWLLPLSLHLAFTRLFAHNIRTIAKKSFPAATLLEPGEITVQLGGRFEIEGISIETPTLFAKAPFTAITPRWLNLLKSGPFFSLSSRSPSLGITMGGNNAPGKGTTRGLSVRRALSRFEVSVQNGSIHLRYGNHQVKASLVSGGGNIGRGLHLRGKLLKYEGTFGLWVGKNFDAIMGGSRLQHISISFIKLFSSDGRELELRGKVDRLAGDALQYEVSMASGSHFVKSQGRCNLEDRIVDGKVNYAVSLGSVYRFAHSFGLALGAVNRPSGYVAGDMHIRFNKMLEVLEGRFALTSFTLRHHLLAAGPVHWPLVSGEIAYSRLEQKEQLNAQFLVMGKAKGAVNIVKTNDNAVKIRGDIPVQPCATIFSVIPAALLPTINDMRLGGETGIHFVTHVPLNDLATLTAHMNFSGPGCFLNMASANVDIEKLKGTPTVTLTDQHGKRVTKLLDPKDPNFIPFEKLPYYLVDAVTTSEDMRFFKHDGFDWPLLVRALGINLSSGRVVKGASTITQQLAKNLFLSTTRSISRKLEESLITWQIERTLSKRRILEIYMNIIEMGPGLRGVNAGTELYFGKRATGISPLEAAHIASIIPAPSFYYQHFRGAPVKDDWSKKIRILLNKTARYGRLSAAMLKEAEKSELVIQDY